MVSLFVGVPAVAAGAVLVALAVDRWLGEPPVRLHPVVWIGHYLGWAGRHVAPPAPAGAGMGAEAEGGAAAGTPSVARVASAGGAVVAADGPAAVPVAAVVPDFRRFGLGALAWWAGAALVLGASTALQQLAAAAPPLLAALVLGLGLKPLLAWRMLRGEVLAVEAALGESLAAGRARLAWLVSRDVTLLSEATVRESAIESLAENLNDSVVAPLFWFAVAGLPGAALYRFANTADAMWGYRGERGGRVWEWAGKWAARADDALSWLPARLTAGLLALAAGGLPGAALRREAVRTPSPNSGWPMAAMALALGVRLAKPGVYALNGEGRAPRAADTARACALAGRAVAVLALGAGAVLAMAWGVRG